MRLLNVGGRLALQGLNDTAVDVEEASNGAFSSSPQDALDRWREFTDWQRGLSETEGQAYSPTDLHAPVGTPRQIFAIGLNYRGHAAETGIELPDTPMVFTKFASCLTGPFVDVEMPPGSVDWEAELVVVIGEGARNVAIDKGWDHVAGLTIGQDLSERDLQIKPPAPQQFSLAKSYPGFGPLGPALVTPDEFDNPDDLAISCSIGTQQVQAARTGDLIFSIPTLVSYLSSILPLYPGDLVFTGTPGGVGFALNPQRYLQEGEELSTVVEGIGTMRQRMVRSRTQR